MFWVIQDNLQSEQAFQLLLDQLDRQDTKYQVVKVIPFIGEMIPEINPEGPIMTIGATSMSKISKRKGWVPGYFDDNLNYQTLLENYGDEMLNSTCIVNRLGNLSHVWDEFHIRPVLDSKSFAGTVMSWDEFSEWRDKVVALGDDENSLTTLTSKDQVVMSPLAEIYAEYRFYVVDGKVITGSMYKNGSRVIYKPDIEIGAGIKEYAQSIVDTWAPNRAFALDIADTPKGYKVIEINAINSAGFYACDMGKFVNAINQMKF